MEENDKKTIVHGDQNIFRDQSRLVKVVVQGFPSHSTGSGQAGSGQAQEFYEDDIRQQAEEAEVIAIEADKKVEPVIDFPKLFQSAPSQAFTHPNDLTRECVKMAVDYCYTGQPTQLAFVMICCFAYNLSNSLTGYKAFVRSLMLWGCIPYDEGQVQQIANTMGCKVRTLHPDFRNKWGDDLAAEKAICEEIGKMFEGRHCYYRYR